MKNASFACVLCLIALLAFPGAARAAGFAGYLVRVDADGIALDGLDPVALAVEQKTVAGKKDFRSCYEGGIYLFASAENRAAFDKAPAKYAPQFGGFCATAVSSGKLSAGKPVLRAQVDGKLYLFCSAEAQRKFQADAPGTIERANAAWPALVRDRAGAVTEAQLTKERELTLDAARKIVDEAARYAKGVGAPGASIAVVDAGGHLLAMERLDGTYPASAQLAVDKARTAALFRRPSRVLEDGADGGRTSLVTMGYVVIRGAVPVVCQGEVVGALGVSGAAGAWQDEEIALAGVRPKPPEK